MGSLADSGHCHEQGTDRYNQWNHRALHKRMDVCLLVGQAGNPQPGVDCAVMGQRVQPAGGDGRYPVDKLGIDAHIQELLGKAV